MQSILNHVIAFCTANNSMLSFRRICFHTFSTLHFSVASQLNMACCCNVVRQEPLV